MTNNIGMFFCVFTYRDQDTKIEIQNVGESVENVAVKGRKECG